MTLNKVLPLPGFAEHQGANLWLHMVDWTAALTPIPPQTWPEAPGLNLPNISDFTASVTALPF